MTAQSFIADGTRGALVRHALRPLGTALTLPLLAYSVFGATLGNALTVLMVGLMLMLLAIWGRMSWGKAIAIDAGDVQITRRDGSSLTVPGRAITALRIKADCAAIAWQEGRKRRSLVIGSETFLPATWQQLAQALQALESQRKEAAVAAP